MARKVGQIIARGDRRWLIRVYLGHDHETKDGEIDTIVADHFDILAGDLASRPYVKSRYCGEKPHPPAIYTGSLTSPQG